MLMASKWVIESLVEPAKDTYRYRVDANTEIFGLRIENAKGKKMGVIGSFGDSLVTSSTWKCKSF